VIGGDQARSRRLDGSISKCIGWHGRGHSALQLFAVALAYPRGLLNAEADRFDFVP
jgi:hypothetical protein